MTYIVSSGALNSTHSLTHDWYFWSKIEQVGVDSDDDIDSIEIVS